MNLKKFDTEFGSLKDKDIITVFCDFPEHIGNRDCSMPKVSARRNILKNNSTQFICRKCSMKFKNPMQNKDAVRRQTDQEIKVVCPDPRHTGNKFRTMKMSGYFGKLEEPYTQVCKSCAQLDKVISEQQKKKISKKLIGIQRSEEFKKKLSNYMKSNLDGISRFTKNLLANRCTTGMLGKHHTQEHKEKMSQIMSGRTYTEEHRQNISEGRKKMLEEQGGLLKETREKLSKAAIQQHINGFDAKTHHARGVHISSKSNKLLRYKSSYEKKAFMKLDSNDDVLRYEYESLSIEYYNPVKEINGSYLVDLVVYFVDGTKKLIEVKPNKWLIDPVVSAKVSAGQAYAGKNNMEFEVWEETKLFGAVYNEKNMRTFCEAVKRGDYD